MTIVYVVTYQSYLYGDEYEDMERVSEGFSVKGVFSTQKNAEAYIQEDLKREAIDMCGEDDKEEIDGFIDKYTDHYNIYKLELDKQDFS